MKLYSFPPSPNSWKVRALAAHLGIPLDVEVVDLTKGGSKTPEFLVVNFMGRTPALVDGDFKLSESTAIMHYLAGQKPSSVWPSEPRARAEVMRWECWALAHWGKEACDPLIFENLVRAIVNMGPPDQAAVAKGLESFKREAGILDAHLAKQPYLVGKDVTLADFAVAAPMFYAEGAHFPLAPYAHIRDWFGRVAALPCWEQTAPQFPAQAA